MCVLYRHPGIEGGDKVFNKGKKWDFKEVDNLRLGKDLDNGSSKKILKINKEKGREVVGMLCKLTSSCWVVAMVVGDQEVFLF